jgi:hypothetical protein
VTALLTGLSNRVYVGCADGRLYLYEMSDVPLEALEDAESEARSYEPHPVRLTGALGPVQG